MTTSDPISRVSVVSTGTVRIRPEHVGPTRKNTYWWLATSRRWTPPRPINAYEGAEQAGSFVTGLPPAPSPALIGDLASSAD